MDAYDDGWQSRLTAFKKVAEDAVDTPTSVVQAALNVPSVPALEC